MNELTQAWEILRTILTNLTDPDAWREVLARPGTVVAGFFILNAIVFTETGLLIGFFLPGDSLLVTAGIVARSADWPVALLIVTLCISAIVGDTVGYWIGAKAGPAIFRRPDGRFFKQGHLLKAKAFYDRHGGKTIIIARFVPIIRTFAPVVAGAAKMQYWTFLSYNVFGGIFWVTSMILFGYYLNELVDPLLKPIFGPQFSIVKHIDKVIIVVILVSVLPLVGKAFHEWWLHRKAPTPPPPAVKPVAATSSETTA
jgi:membrane-associated protein